MASTKRPLFASTVWPSPVSFICHPQRKQPINATTSHNASIQIGKYLVSPLARRLPDSRYGASVSIRSGTSSATHDRVLRLTPVFEDHDEAMRYAVGEGIAWLKSEHRIVPTL